MKTRLLSLSVAVFLLSTLSFADVTVVTTDSELRAAIGNNAFIQLGNDIDLSNSTLEIPSNDTVVIDLNGFTLNRNLTQRGEGGGTVITVRKDAKLSLSHGTLAGGWAGAGGALVNEGGTVTLYHVNCTGCTADNRGGGICNSAGTLTMTGGSITGNTSKDIKVQDSDRVGGGGLFNDINATATLTEVTITGNTTTTYGGGGICNFGTLTMSDCTINGNTANSTGGGIWLQGTLNISGANNIQTNTNGHGLTDNVYLKPDTMLTIVGELTGGQIGIALDLPRACFTKNYREYSGQKDPSTYFTPDVEGLTIDWTKNLLEAQVSGPKDSTVYYNVCSWDEINHRVVTTLDTITSDQYTVVQGATLKPEVITHWSSGYYVSQGDIYIGKIQVEENAETHLILTNGSALHVDMAYAEGYIKLQDHAKLIIHGQPALGNAGLLEPRMIIGAEGKEVHVEVHGGKIHADAHSFVPAIGQENPNRNSTYTFYGGEHVLNGHEGTPGIGGSGSGNAGTITIYGGKITATSSRYEPESWSDLSAAGIGGGDDCTAADIFIHGGEVTAIGGHEGAGIGTSQNVDSGKDFRVIITGGKVTASGHDYAAGIGGGDGVSGCYVEISGGEVYAYGGTDAAGIGGGEGADGGVFIITGGYAHAEGNDNGAGIGGGEDGAGANVSILGGCVYARAGYDETGSRAIGPGNGSDNYGSLTIGDDLMVWSERKAAAAERHDMCWYRTRVHIDKCDHQDHTYTVDGTTATDHHILHCPYCLYSDTGLHHFDAHGTCEVCNCHGEVKSVILWEPKAQLDGSYDGQTYHQAVTHMIVPNTSYALPMALPIPGYKFAGWEVNTEASGETYTSPYSTLTADTLYRVGNRYTVTGNMSFVARYQVTDITLYDNASNIETLAEFDGLTANSVMLSGRTFTKNSIWQMLTLPFSLSAEQLAALPLAGCELKELDTEGKYDDEDSTCYDLPRNTLYLYFKDATAIEAGKPYVIRWTNGGDAIENPVFNSVTMVSQTQDVIAPNCSFMGIFSPKTFTTAEPTAVCLGDNNAFFQPDGTRTVTIGSFRGYVKLRKFYLLQAAAEPVTIVTNLDGIVTPTDLEETNANAKAAKWLRHGLIFIERNGHLYDITGRMIK